MYAQCTTDWSESRTDNAAQWLVHKAKVQLLHERIKSRVEQHYGKELDALADALVLHAKDVVRESSEDEQKREQLTTAFDKVFG